MFSGGSLSELAVFTATGPSQPMGFTGWDEERAFDVFRGLISGSGIHALCSDSLSVSENFTTLCGKLYTKAFLRQTTDFAHPPPMNLGLAVGALYSFFLSMQRLPFPRRKKARQGIENKDHLNQGRKMDDDSLRGTVFAFSRQTNYRVTGIRVNHFFSWQDDGTLF
jgi:hypothetical protein